MKLNQAVSLRLAELKQAPAKTQFFDSPLFCEENLEP